MFIWYKFPWETPQEPPVRGFNFLLFAFFLIPRRQSCLLTHLVSLYPGDLCADIAAINRDAAYSIAWVWPLQIRTWIVSGYLVPLLVVYWGTFLMDMQLGGGVLKSLFWQYSSCLGRPEFGWKMPEYQKGENKQNRKQTNKQKPLSKPIPSPGVEDPGYLSVLRQPFSKSPEN